MTRRRAPGAAWAAGILCANGAPHLMTAARGGTMLTPLAGHDSGPLPNLVWGTVNLGAAAGAMALSVRARPGIEDRSTPGGRTEQDREPYRRRTFLLPFLAGVATFRLWAWAYESAVGVRDSTG